MRKLTILACLLALGALQHPVYAQAQTASKTAKAKLPTGEAIMDKFIEATGGAVAHKKIKSTVIKGKFEAAMGMSGDLTVYAAAPNLRLAEIDLPGIGKMLDGCNGAIAWSFNAMTGPAIKEGKQAQEAMDEATFDEHDWRKKYSGVKAEGLETVEGEECYKVVLTTKAGNPRTHYFSKKTGLLVRIDLTQETEMGEISAQIHSTDYRDVGGVKMPFKLVNTFAGQAMTMTYTEIKVNVDIPRSTFEPPPEVLALLDPEGED